MPLQTVTVSLVHKEDGVYVQVVSADGGEGLHGPVHPHDLLDPQRFQVVVRQPTPGRQAPSKRVKAASMKQEKRVMDAIGGRVQAGSGSGQYAKGDGRLLGVTRVECKLTTKKSFRLEHAVLAKIREEARLGEMPSVQIDFKTPDTLRTYDTWVAIPQSYWEKYVHAIADARRLESPPDGT
jgi:hypothetical protein